jgi:hypothetical protein
MGYSIAREDDLRSPENAERECGATNVRDDLKLPLGD